MLAHRSSWLAFLLVLTTAAARAQDRPVVIRPGRLLDPATGRLESGREVVVRGGRIVAVRDRGGAAGDSMIALPRLTLLPGFVDAHVHLTLAGDPAANARATLEAGFTTVMDLGAVNDAAIELAERIRRGDVAGPRVVAAGMWIGRAGGTCDFSGIGVRGVEGFGARAREQIAAGAAVLKVCVTGWPQDAHAHPDSIEITAEELAAVVAVARSAGRRTAAHAIGAAGVQLAERGGVDVIVHSAFIDGPTASRLRARGGWLLPTAATFGASRGNPAVDSLLAHVARAVRDGLPIAIGSDAGVLPHGRNGAEIVALAGMGLTPLEALRAATVNAAAAVGLAGEIGVLRPDARADLVAIEGDPLADVSAVRRVRWVMQGGQVVAAPRGP